MVKIYSHLTFKIFYRIFPYWVYRNSLIALFVAVGSLSHLQAQEQVEQQYAIVRLELLCKTIRFILTENNAEAQAYKVNCATPEQLEKSIPPEYTQASLIFKMFRTKNYTSYGKGKLDARLNKLIKDLNTELTKLNRDRQWQENVRVLNVQLSETKTDVLEQIKKGTYQTDTTATQDEPATIPTPQPQTNPTNLQSPAQSSSYMPVYFILLFLILAGGIGFLYWQIRRLKEDMIAIEESFDDQFIQIAQRLEAFSTHQAYQSLQQQFHFLNDQLNAAVQEINTLKTRNEYKMSAEELFSKRTEHLEKLNINPAIQVYYAKYRPDIGGFAVADLRTEASRDSIFKLEVNLENGNQAGFQIVQRNEFHTIALQNAEAMLAPACEYVNPPYNDYRILNLESGIAEKRGAVWIILKKAKISFE
jgi:hypothetical protein